MNEKKFDGLQRPIQPMPPYVERALNDLNLMQLFQSRPAYQQNDYLSWINRAKQPQTKEKRLRQMLAELRKGGVYMKMPHPSSRR